MNDQCKHCDKNKTCKLTECDRVPLIKYGKPTKMIDKQYMYMLKRIYFEARNTKLN